MSDARNFRIRVQGIADPSERIYDYDEAVAKCEAIEKAAVIEDWRTGKKDAPVIYCNDSAMENHDRTGKYLL